MNKYKRAPENFRDARRYRDEGGAIGGIRMNYQYGIKCMDSGGYGLFRVRRWSPTHKAQFMRYVLPGIIARGYFEKKNIAPIGSDLHIFR